MSTHATPTQKFAKFEQFLEFAEKAYKESHADKNKFPAACSQVAFRFKTDVPANRSKVLTDAKRAVDLAERFSSSAAWTAADSKSAEAVRLMRGVTVKDFQR